MHAHTFGDDRRGGAEGGFALILAMLSLLLLTFLGLTLAATTSTELQIAANQRWSQQARYNAEAGLQAAQIILRDIATQDSYSLVQALPPEQGTWTMAVPPATPPAPPLRAGPTADAWGVARREYENAECDARGGTVGYGAVLADYTGNVLFQNVSRLFNQDLNGSVTIWVRRPVVPQADGTLKHDDKNTRVVVTAEGTAPYFGDVTQGALLRRRQQAVRVMESTFSISVPEAPCSIDEINQTGLGRAGANFAPCLPIDSFMGRADTGGF